MTAIPSAARVCLQDADEEPLTSSEEEEEDLPSPQQRRSGDASYPRLPSIIKTHLQLGRQSFNRTAPSIFELSRNSSIMDSLQEALSQEAAAAPRVSSPHFESSSSRMFSPRVSATQLAALDSLSAAAAFSRSISLRHTPTLAQLPAPVQDVLESCGALFIEDGNIEGLAGEQHIGSLDVRVLSDGGVCEAYYSHASTAARHQLCLHYSRQLGRAI